MDAQFEHLCRICAANTKCKNNSVVESVFIFKTTGLKDKIARHLFLNVAEEDPLPKVLCKACYRQVEATASLSNIAQHTQRVFRDFLLSTVPKHARQSTETLFNDSPSTSASTQNLSTSGSTSKNAKSLCSNFDNDPKLVTRPPETTVPPSLQLTSCSQKKDNVISLTNNEIEMRQQQKQQRNPNVNTEYTSSRSSIKMNNLMLPTRRNSVFVDTRYSSAPMSIAQRSMQQPPSLAPLHSEVSLSKASKNNIEKRISPAGVINFIQTHGRITGNAPTITNTAIDKEYNNTIMQIKRPASCTSSASASQTVVNAGRPNLPKSVFQQKRRNLKNTLNNISAIRDGQVSLLKSSQHRPITEDMNIRPLVTTTVVPHQSLYGVEPSVEEALPEHIIIAAPKKKKEEPSNLVRSGVPKLQKTAANPTKSVKASYDAEPAAKSKTEPSISCLTDAVSLGNVIRDPDLLKLILKALKWPVTTDNCDEQMARLKNSKFAVIMSDSNLLQDTDLTQLLGPYLGPIMAVAQQHKNNPPAAKTTTTVKTPMPASPPQAAGELRSIGECTMPYKLPPETSVQLVPSSPTEKELPYPISNKSMESQSEVAKPSQRKSRVDDLFVDGQSSTAVSKSNVAHVTNELLNINAMLISQFGANPADALNEALISMLKQQQESKSKRTSRRRRSSSTTNTSPNLEDIVLVEPQSSLELPPTPANDVDTHTMPPQPIIKHPPITRPIIKRRKAVMQASKESCSKNMDKGGISMLKTDENTPKTELLNEIAKNADCNKKLEDSMIQHVVETIQAPTSTVPEINLSNKHDSEPECATEIPASNASLNNIPSEPSSVSARKSNVKSALGQKLLEAIGLPQPGKNVPTESSRDTLRSALKRSLKQAQEQQQQLKRVKHEEPVKQMADSTTKSVAGEASEEHKKAIAERELELLTRKTKNAEKVIISFKDEKSERTDVSSSSSRNRRNRKKSKTDANEDDFFAEERKNERWDEDDDLPLKTDLEKNMEQNNRPTRSSKTLSKYYKSPGSDKALSTQKSQHAMGRRSTRQR